MAKKKKVGAPKKEAVGYKITVRLRGDDIKKELNLFANKTKLTINDLVNNMIKESLERHIPSEDLSSLELSNCLVDFLKKSFEKSDELDNLIQKKLWSDFKRKDSVKTYIYDLFPDKIQREKFYIDLLYMQITNETNLFNILFTLSSFSSKERISYFDFHSEKHDLKNDDYKKCHNQLMVEILNEWYHELKLYGIITDLNDLKVVSLNYDALETLLLNILKTKFIPELDSNSRSKSQQKKPLHSDPNDFTKENERFEKRIINNLIKQIFALLFYVSGNPAFRSAVKMDFEPHILSRILDLNGYYKYIRDNNQFENFSFSLRELIEIYSTISTHMRFPPYDLIDNAKGTLDNFHRLNKFLKRIPKLSEFFDDFTLFSVKNFLEHVFIKEPVYVKDGDELLKQLSTKNLEEIYNIKPNNIDDVLDLINNQIEKNKNL